MCKEENEVQEENLSASGRSFPNAVFLSIMAHYYFLGDDNYWDIHLCGTIQHESDKMPESVSDALDFAYKRGLLAKIRGAERESQIGGYRITEKREAYVKGLLAVPFPEQRWVIPPGG